MATPEDQPINFEEARKKLAEHRSSDSEMISTSGPDVQRILLDSLPDDLLGKISEWEAQEPTRRRTRILNARLTKPEIRIVE